MNYWLTSEGQADLRSRVCSVTEGEAKHGDDFIDVRDDFVAACIEALPSLLSALHEPTEVARAMAGALAGRIQADFTALVEEGFKTFSTHRTAVGAFAADQLKQAMTPGGELKTLGYGDPLKSLIDQASNLLNRCLDAEKSLAALQTQHTELQARLGEAKATIDDHRHNAYERSLRD